MFSLSKLDLCSANKTCFFSYGRTDSSSKLQIRFASIDTGNLEKSFVDAINFERGGQRLQYRHDTVADVAIYVEYKINKKYGSEEPLKVEIMSNPHSHFHVSRRYLLDIPQK